MDIEDLIIVHPDDIRTRPPFSDLFPAYRDITERIMKSMDVAGYDVAQPVHVWRQGECLIDGHQRCRAAALVGVDVYAFIHDFETEDDALDYAIANQRDRRNLTDAEILSAVRALRKRKSKGGDRRSETAKSKAQPCAFDSGKSSTEAAEKIGISERKVEQAITVLSDPVEEAAVMAGEKSINQGAKAAREKKAAAGIGVFTVDDPLPGQAAFIEVGTNGHAPPAKRVITKYQALMKCLNEILILMGSVNAPDTPEQQGWGGFAAVFAEFTASERRDAGNFLATLIESLQEWAEALEGK